MKHITKIFAWLVVLIFYFCGTSTAAMWIGTNLGMEIAEFIVKGNEEEKNGK